MWWLRQEWTDIYTVGYKSAQAKPWHLHASEIKTENMEDKLPAVHQLYVPVESTSNSIQVVKRLGACVVGETVTALFSGCTSWSYRDQHASCIFV
jgi:hypothetical protein